MSAAEQYGELADKLHEALLADPDSVIHTGSTRDALAIGIEVGAQVGRAVVATAGVLSDAIGVRIDPEKLLDAVVNGMGC
ncbi:hypothetical protein [Williamsia deligens]|uniref:Uncharacterized protein n=1 Tax=Williamsia deligens TaxID=321325 RepID=A0ABW3GDZ1_9NOCA|nr:hypothetical protein [Williamsia deligens]MCP2196334.1 hypothetical protein [Williamsia deligens]